MTTVNDIENLKAKIIEVSPALSDHGKELLNQVCTFVESAIMGETIYAEETVKSTLEFIYFNHPKMNPRFLGEGEFRETFKVTMQAAKYFKM